ncbi:MAG: HAD-IC family P-type ATPase, partial [Erysipelotrichaceae bacterium]|nr:HAD-IC family P-type ATPase [Erysipelotrichaceae bacterium]
GKFENIAEANDEGVEYDKKLFTTMNPDTFEPLIPSVNQIKISYDKKANGNISIAGIEIYEAIKNGNSYAQAESPLMSWEFNDENKDDELKNLLGKYSNANKYLDGSIKLDETGSYIISKAFPKSLERFYIRVFIQSRGYGFDDTYEEQLVVREQIIRQTVTKTAGSLVGMIPAGLFLLVTIALALSVTRLARSKTLVQEIYCIEMLARVDCICLDKTGTITDGTMKVKDIIDIATLDPKSPSIDTLMGAFLGANDDNNLTSIALKEKFGVNFDFRKIAVVPFSSTRKCSAVTFEDLGTFILGAPEFVYNGKSKKIWSLVNKKSSMGYRVLMLAKSDKAIVGDVIPRENIPVALITLEDHIREEAYDTIKWFKDNGVQVKVISGDNPATVAEIANKVGVEGANDYISLDGLSPQEVETIASEYTVFGRVTPDQKAILIRTLKRNGKTVAMTGDGVNDILAMKESDCSIAMASGSDAARNVAHLVLLDSNFANMPKVVLEGRRVINNIQQSASLYLMKTLFVMVITILSIIARNIFKSGYPFEPIQFMLLEFFVIGAPSTALAIQPNKEKIKGSFIANIFANCVIQAFCLALTVVSIYLIAAKDFPGLDLSNLTELNSICVIAITYVGVIILFNLCKPFNAFRVVVCFLSLFFITFCLAIPEIANILGITYQFKDITTTNKLFTIAIVLAILPIEEFLAGLVRQIKEKRKITDND